MCLDSPFSLCSHQSRFEGQVLAAPQPTATTQHRPICTWERFPRHAPNWKEGVDQRKAYAPSLPHASHLQTLEQVPVFQSRKQLHLSECKTCPQIQLLLSLDTARG